MDCRYTIDDPFDLLSPSLVIFRDLARKNLVEMITMARGPNRLRPHVKTHKMAQVVRMARELGISKHKCATIAEAEMVAASGGTDVLLAYPLVGPNLLRWARLIRAYPGTTFRAIVDHPDSARALSEAVQDLDRPVPVLVDLEVGMGRTGIDPGEPAAALYALIARLPNLEADGLHAYDGHINETDVEARRESGRAARAPDRRSRGDDRRAQRGASGRRHPRGRSLPGRDLRPGYTHPHLPHVGSAPPHLCHRRRPAGGRVGSLGPRPGDPGVKGPTRDPEI
jgi:D-serine deaminase-like pyridoxal phosphate-dependent protein